MMPYINQRLEVRKSTRSRRANQQSGYHRKVRYRVFGDGIDELEGEYRIRLDDTVDPIQHAPRRIPVALRDRLKTTLDDMVRNDIIEAVEQPTEWISSMVVLTKKDSKLRICLDPKDLNRAIRRELSSYRRLKISRRGCTEPRCSPSLTSAMGFGTCASTNASHI